MCNDNVLEPDLLAGASIDMLIIFVLSFRFGILPLCLISIFIDDVAMTFAYCSCDIYTHMLVIEWSSHTRVFFCHLDPECVPPLTLHMSAKKKTALFNVSSRTIKYKYT